MLFEVVTINLHYMTDRHEWFDLKISKLKLLWKQRKSKINFKLNYPFKVKFRCRLRVNTYCSYPVIEITIIIISYIYILLF